MPNPETLCTCHAGPRDCGCPSGDPHPNARCARRVHYISEACLVDREVEDYEWQCFGTIVCDPLTDEHGRECDRLNDEARAEHYAELVAEDIGNLVAWHVSRALRTVA